jgi:hypothetical protein
MKSLSPTAEASDVAFKDISAISTMFTNLASKLIWQTKKFSIGYFVYGKLQR